MKRTIKAPDIRKQEIIQAAKKLFETTLKKTAASGCSLLLISSLYLR